MIGCPERALPLGVDDEEVVHWVVAEQAGVVETLNRQLPEDSVNVHKNARMTPAGRARGTSPRGGPGRRRGAGDRRSPGLWRVRPDDLEVGAARPDHGHEGRPLVAAAPAGPPAAAPPTSADPAGPPQALEFAPHRAALPAGGAHRRGGMASIGWPAWSRPGRSCATRSGGPGNSSIST